MEDRGLYNKYEIVNRETGKTADGDYFILNPQNDPAALVALEAYATSTTNMKLAEDLWLWIAHLSGLDNNK